MVSVAGVGERLEGLETEGLRFESNFDGGNLASVEWSRTSQCFELRVAKDCEGTEFERRSATWFHFAVRSATEKRARFRIVNMNKQSGLFRGGLRPVCRRRGNEVAWSQFEGDGGWDRVPGPLEYRDREGQGQVTWEWRFTETDAEAKNWYEFAFCYPYSCREIDATLRAAEARAHTNGFYFHRETLCRTLDGRPVDLVTVAESLPENSVPESVDDDDDDDDVDGGKDRDSSWLFPEARTGVESRALRPPEGRPEIIVSARVHPGETPASFIFDGVLDALTRNDPVSRRLRALYAWRLIPCLNPDGVFRGHYRHDARGVNLNRAYGDCPDRRRYPAQAAYVYLAKRAARTNTLAACIDLHAHAATRGVFVFGNCVDGQDRQIDAQLFALLASVYSPAFDYSACNFSKAHMARPDRKKNRDGNKTELTDRDNDDGGEAADAGGSARVAVYRATGIARVYTVETNYAAAADGTRLGPVAWRAVGRGLLDALLDLDAAHPASRLQRTRWRSLEDMRAWLLDKSPRLLAHGPGVALPFSKGSTNTPSSSPSSSFRAGWTHANKSERAPNRALVARGSVVPTFPRIKHLPAKSPVITPLAQVDPPAAAQSAPQPRRSATAPRRAPVPNSFRARRALTAGGASPTLQ